MLPKLDNVSRIYFFDNGFGVRGGANFMLNLINYLLSHNFPVGLIDFHDGYMRESLLGKDVYFVDYEAPYWTLEPNSVVFCPVERVCLIKNIKNAKNIKIITILWETNIGWNILYPNNILKKLSKLLKKTDSLMFMDLGCKFAAERQLGRTFGPYYLPLYFNLKSEHYSLRNIVRQNEMNIAWLGRLSDVKCYSLLNLIKKYNEIETPYKKVIHIIGDGNYQDELNRRIQNINNLSVEVKFMGVLKGKALNSYLIKNVDILFAMGTSMLNGAALKLPVVGVSETDNSNLDIDAFIWLFNEQGLQLGLPDTYERLRKYNPEYMSLSLILNDIYDKKQKSNIGNLCYKYYLEKHNKLENTIKILLDCINRSSLTYEKLEKLFRFLPFNALMTHTVTIFGLPFTIIHNGGTRLYQICGRDILSIKIEDGAYYRKKYKLFGKFTFFRNYWCGRYSFPNIFDRNLK